MIGVVVVVGTALEVVGDRAGGGVSLVTTEGVGGGIGWLYGLPGRAVLAIGVVVTEGEEVSSPDRKVTNDCSA